MEFIDTKCQNPTEYRCQNCGRQICAMCVQSFDNDDLTDDSVVLICDGCVYGSRSLHCALRRLLLPKKA